MTALDWIGQVIEWLGRFIPRLIIVRSTDKGIKFVCGKNIKQINPGLIVYWPLTTEIELITIVRQVLKLDSQMLMTADNKTIVISAVLVFTIIDVEKFLTKNYDSDTAIEEVANAAIRDSIIKKTLIDIQDNKAIIGNMITKNVQKILEPFGVDVEYVRIVDLAPTKVISLTGIPQFNEPDTI